MEQAAPKRRKTDHPKPLNLVNGQIPWNRNVVSSAHESDLFALQVEELLSEIRPKASKKVDKIDSVLRLLKSKIENIDAHVPLSVRRPTISLSGLMVIVFS